MKKTKKYFCEIYPEHKKMKINDPLQFQIIFNEWKRKNFNSL